MQSHILAICCIKICKSACLSHVLASNIQWLVCWIISKTAIYCSRADAVLSASDISICNLVWHRHLVFHWRIASSTVDTSYKLWAWSFIHVYVAQILDNNWVSASASDKFGVFCGLIGNLNESWQYFSIRSSLPAQNKPCARSFPPQVIW